MLFNSIQFLIFLPVVIASYYCLPEKFRPLMLLLASYYFYMSWKIEYAFLILLSTVSVYCLALALNSISVLLYRRLLLFFGVIFNFGILFTFKYFNFFVDLFSMPFDAINLILPVGISFYTFQAVSYLVDVYKKDIKPETSFVIFALYVSFFPQLVAGPIERASNLLPQFKEKHPLKYDNFRKGFRFMLWGFFLKVVVADRSGLLVDVVYGSLELHSGTAIWLATYFFAFQIYADFAGYSFIAIGVARFLGINLMFNFKRPYFAKSFSDFWRRWHISLYDWFRDYIYIPMGGSRVNFLRLLMNIMVVFLISGLWHGASLNFVAWGAIHGLYLILALIFAAIYMKLFGKKKIKIPKIVSYILVFHLVCFSWVFFRASSIQDATLAVNKIFNGGIGFSLADLSIGPGLIANFFTMIFIGIVFAVHFIQEKKGEDFFDLVKKKNLRWLVYSTFVLSILMFGIFDKSEFIYFTF
jgi:alginate O-acetyltransferase complex protein AlgI